MDFNLSEEQTMLREGVSRLVRERYPLAVRRKLAESELGFDATLWQEYAELGWLGLAVPEEAGGLGLSFVETAIVAEELGRGMVLEPYVSCAVLCTRIIERCAQAADRAALLDGLANGKLRACLAHGEEGTRYEVAAALRSSAERRDGRFLLKGRKMLAVGAPSADWLIVSAGIASQPEEGFALFLVEAGAASLARRDYRLIDGSRASDVELRSVSVGPERMIAAPGEALAVLEDAFDRAALASVAEALGAMEAILDISVEHLKTRVQFGQPLGRFQALQHRLAEMFLEVHETRSHLYRGLVHIESPPPQRAAAVSAAKAFAGRAAKFVAQQGIQLHGGMGITEEHVIGELYRKIFAFEKLYGDTDFHVQRFARLEVGDELRA
jgi:alkylation response protein AidB-like acyl-CoA dehydrogenase